jgi:hypothetical protein
MDKSLVWRRVAIIGVTVSAVSGIGCGPAAAQGQMGGQIGTGTITQQPTSASPQVELTTPSLTSTLKAPSAPQVDTTNPNGQVAPLPEAAPVPR